MNTALPALNPKLLTQPLAEFCDRLSAPANLHRTLNRLLFENLLQQGAFQPDELQNLNALLDFLLACQVAQGATFIVGEA